MEDDFNMTNNYYVNAIKRYFSTLPPYFMLLSVPLMFYGYWEDDLCFWIGLVVTVGALVVNHVYMKLMNLTFGPYATMEQIYYVENLLSSDNKVLPKQVREGLFNTMADLTLNRNVTVVDLIKQINKNLEIEAGNGNAEAHYWLGIYHLKLSKEKGHGTTAKQLIEKSAELGFDGAKKMLKKRKKWA